MAYKPTSISTETYLSQHSLFIR